MFYVGFVFVMFFVFVLFPALLFQSMKNIVSLILVFFELRWLKGHLFYLFYDFALVFLVLFVCSLNKEVVLFCVCVVCCFCNKTKWLSCLHLVGLLPFLLSF